MEKVGRFKNDQLAVLDLLFRKFSLLTDPKNKSLPKVEIYIGDLKHYKLPREVFAEVIASFKNDALKIIWIVDQDELESHFNVGDPVEEPPVFEVQLPNNFPALYNRMTATDSQDNAATQIGPLEFDGLTGVLRHDSNTHVFQKKSKSGGIKLKLFGELWEESRHEGRRNKKLIKIGEAFPARTFASRIGLIDSPRDYERDSNAKASFQSLIKSINRSLKTKRFPARIEQKGGVQLVIKE